MRPSIAATIALAALAGSCNKTSLVQLVKPLLATNVCSQGTGAVGLVVNVRGPDGSPVDLLATGATLGVETRGPANGFVAASNVIFDPSTHPTIEVALVADNSGSEQGSLALEKQALKAFSDSVLPRPSDDLGGLVRVSTQASVEQAPTLDAPALDTAIDGLFIANGWTALWDGIRQGNAMLATSGGSPALRCAAGPYPAIIAFTDGRDNNSADQHSDPALGDGVDTTLADLANLSIDGVLTNVTTIGVGAHVDAGALIAVAQNGGRYVHISGYPELVAELTAQATLIEQSVAVTFTPASCDQTEARITVSYTSGGSVVTLQTIVALPATYC